jgi:hypothetical protein
VTPKILFEHDQINVKKSEQEVCTLIGFKGQNTSLQISWSLTT